MRVLCINSSTPIFYFAVLLGSCWRLIYYQFVKRIKYIFSTADSFLLPRLLPLYIDCLLLARTVVSVSIAGLCNTYFSKLIHETVHVMHDGPWSTHQI